MLALLCRRVSLTGSQIRELGAETMERHFVRAGFCEYEAREVAVGIVVAAMLDVSGLIESEGYG